MRFAAIYGSGAAIGFTPQQVNEMSVWQFFAALDGYIKANSGGDGAELTGEELEDLWDWIKG